MWVARRGSGRDGVQGSPILYAVHPARSLCLPLVFLLLQVSAPVRAAAPARLPAAVVVAAAVTEDATASNNQVKMVRAPTGLVVAYAGVAGGRAQVFLAASRDEGAHWARLAQASGGAVPSRLPAIALDRSGRLHVIWTRYDSGVGKIYYRVWAGRWTGPQRRISPPAGYAGYPALALDPAGLPRVVWYGIREGSVPAYTRHGSIYEIYYTGFDGRTWSAPLLISTGVPDSVNPALASDPAGRLSAVWYQYNGRAYQVRYAAKDGAWSGPEGVFHTASDEFNPDLAVDAAGRVHLAWEHHDGMRSTISYARRVRGGWDGPIMLSDGASPARHPSVAVTSAGAVYVAWDEDDGQIYLRRYAGRWGPTMRLTADGGNAFPSVAADGAGAGVVWTHTRRHQSRVDFLGVPPR